MKRNDMCIDNIPAVITCACILHNVCELHGDSFNDAWLRDVESNTEYNLLQALQGMDLLVGLNRSEMH